MRILLLCVLATCVLPLSAQEICDNGLDDDGDGLFDIQDPDCSCASDCVGVLGAFEELSCCPQSFTTGPGTGINCLNDGWVASGIGTTDAFNTCGYLGDGFILPVIPQPLPEGNGAVGMYTNPPNNPGYDESLARCLDEPFLAGETYNIEFFVGFNTSPLVNSSSTEFSVYLKPDCSNIPNNASFACPAQQGIGWVEVATFPVTAVINGWVQVTGSFTSPGTYSAIAFGKSCDFVNSNSFDEYHYLDGLEISGNFGGASGTNCASSISSSATLAGDCASGYFLTGISPDASQFQWYRDGIAIPGATSNPWNVNPVIPGDYQVRAIAPDGRCGVSEPINFNPDLNTLVIDNDNILPSCPGDADGSIELIFNSPNSPFDINWNTGDDDIILENIGAGTYTVTVTDANGCFGEQTISLGDPEPVSSETDIDQPTQNQNGSVTITTSGGSAPYTYDWNNGLSGPVQDNLDPGTYTVTVTDDNGCEEILFIDILDLLSATIDVFDETCLDQCEGTAVLQPEGGLAPYSYSWSVPGGTSVQLNLCAGSYGYTVTDAIGTEVSGNFDIQPGSTFDAEVVQDGIRCDNSETTNLDLTVIDGVGPFSYNWSSGASTEDVFGVGSGNFSVTVTDVQGCEAEADIQVLPVVPLQLNSSVTDIDCNNPGSIFAFAIGGTAPLQYEWSSGQTTNQISNIPAGEYELTVTDANNCSVQGLYTVEEFSQISASGVLAQPACANDSTGAIDLTVDEGTAPFTFSWSSGETTEDLSNLAPGDYTVTVSDNSNCESVRTFTIASTSTVDLSATIDEVSCPGGNDGAVNVTTSGSLLPLSLNWSTGSDSTAITDLSADTYTLTITDAGGCVYESSYELTEPDLFVIDSLLQPNACFGDTAAFIEILPVTAGTYSASWNTGAEGLLLENLSAGSYSVTVTSEANCQQSYSFALTDDNPALGVIEDEVRPSCGDANGSLTLAPLGGVGPYTYAWSTGEDAATISGLAAGTYGYTVTDAVGCIFTGLPVLDEESTTTLTSSVVDPTCPDAENGSINLDVTSGAAPFTFSWSNGESSQNIADVGVGFYTAEVVDANGCTTVREFDLVPTSSLDVDAVVDDVSCFDGANGSISTSVTASLTPLTFAWSNAADTPNLTDVPADNYTLTITDAAGCAYESSYEITQPELFVIDSLIDLNDCFGDSSAAIEIVPPSTGIFTAEWSTGDAGLSLSNLSSGDYSVLVRSDLGCEQAYDFTIEDPNPELLALADLTAPTCDEANGVVSLSLDGGQGPYTVEWAGGQSGETITDLSEGDYQYTVTDALGCTTVESIFLAEEVIGSFTPAISQPTCPGAADGSISLSLSGVAEPFDIQWSNGEIGSDINNLGEGSISVEIIDANGCLLTDSFELEEQSNLSISSVVTDADCFGGDEGAIVLDVTAAQEPLEFNWSNAAEGSSLSGLEAGEYELIITDALGCEYASSYTIIEPEEFIIDSLITLNDCFGGSAASIEIVPPATGTFTAEWNTTDTGLSLIDLQAGDYSVSVTSDLGCVQEYAFQIVDEVEPISIDLAASDPICGFDNGSISAIVSGGNGPFTFDWGTAGSGADLTDLGDGDYALLVTDQTGCTATIDTFLMPYPELTNSFDVQEPLCADDATGAISLVPNGGTTPYTFSWSNSETAPEIEGLTADDYEVTITDALGCELVETITINEPEPLQLDQNVTQPLCFGDLANVVFGPSGGSGTYTFSGDLTGAALTYDLPAGDYNFELLDENNCSLAGLLNIVEPDELVSGVVSALAPQLGVENGQISAEASGGTPPYTFEWSNGDTGADIDGLGPGTYTAIVTDANGCQTTISATLAQPAPLSFALGSTDNLCAGTCTGTINLQLAGGTEPYTISWSDGQSGTTATDLCNGQYRAEITDVNGNSIITDFVTISSPEELEVTTSNVAPVSCENTADGTIAIDLSGGTAPYNYNWDGNSGGPTLSNLSAGTYELRATDANGCPITETFIVEDYEVREFGFSTSVTNCDFDEYEIVIFDPQLDELDWLLNGERAAVDASGVVRGLSPGAYELSYQESSGCQVAVEAFNFDGLAPYQLLIDESPREVEFGDPVELEVLASPLDQLEREGLVSWSSINAFACVDGTPENCGVIELIAESSEVVEFSYRDDRGCLSEFRIPIFVAQPEYAYIPSAFSPNDDGINDDFVLFTTDFVEAVTSARIYNRWGEIVIEDFDLSPGEIVLWDGRRRGQNAKIGVYVYAISLRLADGEEVVLSGDVTLVR
ncbi:MAG: gliding motility-associated C-terminal domain-containing protein [Bacteroidota bacterium]